MRVSRQRARTEETPLSGAAKICYRCGKPTLLTDFYVIHSKVRPLRRLHSWCKTCHVLWSQAYRAQNLEACRERSREWQRKRREETRAP